MWLSELDSGRPITQTSLPFSLLSLFTVDLVRGCHLLICRCLRGWSSSRRRWREACRSRGSSCRLIRMTSPAGKPMLNVNLTCSRSAGRHACRPALPDSIVSALCLPWHCNVILFSTSTTTFFTLLSIMPSTSYKSVQPILIKP